MAAYGDRPGQLARRELARQGWQLDAQVQKDAKSEAKFHIATKGTATVLTVAGTASLADVKSDLNFHSIAYDGSTGKAAKAADMRKVHAGFDYYTKTLLAAPYGGATVADTLTAAAKAPGTLTLTGHSLGGAVATLAGARLADRGVSRLYVVTFGAPAVGNKPFNDVYQQRLHLDRIVMKGDPVQGALQNISASYGQFPDKHEWQPSPVVRRFAHDMVGYADTALHRYYDAKEAYEKSLGHALKEGEIKTAGPAVWVLPLTVTADDALASDIPYWQKALDDQLRSCIHAGFAPKTQTLTEALREARKNGCTQVLIRSVTAKQLKNKDWDFRLTYEETTYDAVTGCLLTSTAKTTDTQKMTPIEVLLDLGGRR